MPAPAPESLVGYLRGLAEARAGCPPADDELVRRFAEQRDEAAFAALVKRHGAMVLGVCRRVLRHEQDAEDAFQAVFLVLSRKAASLHNKGAVGPWLFGVAHRLALKARGAARRWRERETHPAERAAADPLAELTVREAQAVLDQELARLPERERGPLILCYLEGLTRDEAAGRLGCPLGTLKTRLERGRAALQKRLTRRGLTLTGAVSTLLVTAKSAGAVPVVLHVATVRTAAAFAAGALAGGQCPAAALAEGALTSWSAGKLKVAGAALLLTLACGVGAGLAAWWAAGQDRPDRSAPVVVAPGQERAVAEAPRPAPARAVAPPSAEGPGPAEVPRPAGPRADKPPQPAMPPAPARKPPPVLTKWTTHATLPGHQRGARALQFTPDGSRLLSGGDDGRVRVWDVAQKKELLVLANGDADPVRSLALADGGAIVAAGKQDGTVVLWDIHKGQQAQAVLKERGLAVQALHAGAGRGRLVWARDDGAVEGNGGRYLPGRRGEVDCVALSPDGRTAAWGMHDGSVRLWDVAEQKERGRFPVHSHPVSCVIFSADGRTVASVELFGTVCVWDASTGRQQALLRNPCRGGHIHVLALAFSPDGRLMATGGGVDHTIRVWERRAGRQLAHLLDHRGPIFGLAFSPDGRLLASASGDGTVRLWMGAGPPGAD
jgi:RNA polymerase sigma factor (sigma-70 family)